MRPGIDIVVVNYRCPEDLRHFLNSVLRYPPAVPWSIAIVNVDPTEEDERTAWAFPEPFDYKQFADNVGYARAVNFASAFGDRETLAIFNADTRLLENVATECHNMLQSTPEWGVLGPRQIDNKNLVTHGGFFESERGFHHRNSEQYADVRDDARTVSGSAYFIKRTVWDELTECPIYRTKYPNVEGAFLPTRHYWEETWASFHARKHGYKVVYYGPAVMIHNWHSASPRGGFAERQIPISRAMFREMCEAHDITY